MQNSKYLILISATLAGSLMIMNCSSSKTSVLKDGSGKVIGRYDTISDTEARANWDTNQNGINERVSTYKDKNLVGVDYFDDTNGAKTKSVAFKEGKPSEVKVYNKGGDGLRGDVTIDPGSNTGKEVTLPSKNKKVVFNGDGTMSVSPIQAPAAK